MFQIPVTNIVVASNRQRRDFDQEKIFDLADSIARLGLLHPIVVRRDSESVDKFILVAGERRLRACQELLLRDIRITVGLTTCDPDYIPVTNLESLSPREAFEAELEENILRVDLSWQERAEATARLHEFRQEVNPAQTLTATATEILGSPASGTQTLSISDDIILAQHLDIPEVAKAATKKDALKAIRKIKETAHRAELAKVFDLSKTPHTLILGDSLEELTALAADSFDVLLTDPPYGINADSFGGQASTGHTYSDDADYFHKLSSVLARESFRVCKSSAHAYVFCDVRHFPTLSFEFEAAGWYVWATPLIWAKSNGMLPRPDHGPRRTYETIMYAIKGDRRVTAVYPDVITISNEAKINHGAQKPVDLYVNLLQRSVRPGDTVLDPFAGSGTIFPAADRVKCTALGVEINPNYYNLAKLRMQGDTEEAGDELDIPGLN